MHYFTVEVRSTGAHATDTQSAFDFKGACFFPHISLDVRLDRFVSVGPQPCRFRPKLRHLGTRSQRFSLRSAQLGSDTEGGEQKAWAAGLIHSPGNDVGKHDFLYVQRLTDL